MLEWATIENYEQIESYYRNLGPIIGLMLPFIEAFLPFIPLVVIVVANANAFGLLWGFIISWIGTVVGSFCVFLIVRKYGHHPRLFFFTKNRKVEKLIRWVDMNGLSPLLVLLCFPFTPSVLVNIVAGLSNIYKTYYFIVLLLGKLVMIFMMSFVGHDITELVRSPLRISIAVIVTILLWFVGKLIERRLNKRIEQDLKTIQQTNINNAHGKK